MLIKSLKSDYFIVIFGALLILGIFLIVSDPIKAASTSDNFNIWTDTFSAGGGLDTSESNDYTIDAVIGESFVGNLSGSDYTVMGGLAGIDMDEDSVVYFSVDFKQISMGLLSRDSTAFATHTMSAYSNADRGYTIRLNSDPPQNELGYDIDGIGSSPVVAISGTEQFGINLVNNSDPAIGADPSGGIGQANTNYDQTNKFAYNKSDIVASASGSTGETTYTVSVIMNISGATVAGYYTIDLSYLMVANF